jgi:hypothetical protein
LIIIPTERRKMAIATIIIVGIRI